MPKSLTRSRVIDVLELTQPKINRIVKQLRHQDRNYWNKTKYDSEIFLEDLYEYIRTLDGRLVYEEAAFAVDQKSGKSLGLSIYRQVLEAVCQDFRDDPNFRKRFQRGKWFRITGEDGLEVAEYIGKHGSQTHLAEFLWGFSGMTGGAGLLWEVTTKNAEVAVELAEVLSGLQDQGDGTAESIGRETDWPALVASIKELVAGLTPNTPNPELARKIAAEAQILIHAEEKLRQANLRSFDEIIEAHGTTLQAMGLDDKLGEVRKALVHGTELARDLKLWIEEVRSLAADVERLDSEIGGFKDRITEAMRAQAFDEIQTLSKQAADALARRETVCDRVVRLFVELGAQHETGGRFAVDRQATHDQALPMDAGSSETQDFGRRHELLPDSSNI